MRVEIINTGTELLLGSVVNTHLRFLGECLFPFGLRVARQITLPDGDEIRTGLLESFSRCEILFVTGGLGPTSDDLTRDVVAELFGLPLHEDETVLNAIRERFERRGLSMGLRVRLQAQVPQGATVLWNDHGTAPGLYLSPDDLGLSPSGETVRSPHLFLLPGPPRELYPMFRDRVEPLLRAIVGTPPDRVMRQFRIVGMGESMVEETVGAQLAAIGLEVGYCARLGEVDLRLIGPHALVEEGSRFVRGAFRSAIFAEGLESLEGVVVALLRDRGATVTTAESCTGGAIISRLLSVPGASAVVEQASVVYSAAAKARVLGISPDIIETNTVYSEAVASAMAEHALRIAGADYALATTGVAGPGGGTASAPVGTVFVAIASRKSATAVRRCFFPTDREAFVHHVTQTGLAMLRTALLGEDVDL